MSRRSVGAADRGGRRRHPAAILLAAFLALAAALPEPARAADPAAELQLQYRPPAVGEDAPPGNRQRALLEFAAILLAENARYWTENKFVEDWQFKLTWGDQVDKLIGLEGVRFDSNAFETNWTHAPAGGVYYTLGRINNLGVKDSLYLAVFESLYWELVVEWREVVSVNDMVTTVFGALSVGEPWYQLSRYLLTRPEPVTRGLGFIHPLMGLHALLDPASRPRPTEKQTLPGHGVLLSLGAASVDSRYQSDSGGFTNVELRSRFALAPGYASPGRESRRGWEVLSSAAHFSADLDGGKARELEIFTGAVFWGRLQRSVGEDLRGSGSILGLGSAFTLHRKAQVFDLGVLPGDRRTERPPEVPRDYRDRHAVMHLFGPVYQGYWRGSGAGVTWAVEAYPNFALVNAYALNAYSAGHDISGVKSTLHDEGYYYGYGASVSGRIDAGAGPVSLGVAAALHYHESIEGIDRFEDQLAGDVHASDTWFRVDARLGVSLPGTPLGLEATARWSSRRGVIGDTVAKGTESRYTLGVTCRL